jgi:hypothetical protein
MRYTEMTRREDTRLMMKIHGSEPRVRWTLSLVLTAACAACAPFEIVTWDFDSNHITYRHPYTDAAAAAVLKNAERLCAQKSQVPVRTTHACSLTDCTSHYQCMDKTDAERYR